MSFNWNSVEQREQKKFETEKQLKAFLLTQQEEVRKKKQEAKMREIEEARRTLAQADERIMGAPVIQSTKLDNYTTMTNPPGTHSFNNGFNTNGLLSANTPLLSSRTTPLGMSNNNATPNPGFPPNNNSFLNSLRLNTSPTLQPLGTASLASGNSATSNNLSTSTANITTRSGGPNNLATPSSGASSFTHQMTVKYLEDRLEQERRAREQLEGELRLGKSMMSQLSSRLELLQNQVHLQQQKNSLTSGLNSESNGNEAVAIKNQVKREVDRLNDSVLCKVEQMMSEYIGLKTKLHDVHDSDMKRYKSVLDEVDQLKLMLSTYMTKTSELHQDHATKENLLMMEQSKASELTSVVLSHEQYLKGLQKQMESKWNQLDQAVQALKMDTARVESHEDGIKKQMDQIVHDLQIEIQKAVQSRTMPLEADIKNLGIGVRDIADGFRLETEKLGGFLNEQTHQLNTKLTETKTVFEEQLKLRFKTMEEWLSHEQVQNAKRELQLRTELENTIKTLDQRVSRDILSAKDDLRQKFTTSIKGLQQAIHLVEETSSTKIDRLEKVMKAEIEHRMDQQKRIESLIQSLQDGLRLQETNFNDSMTQVRFASDQNTSKILGVQSLLAEVYATKDHVKNDLTIVQAELQDTLIGTSKDLSSQISQVSKDTMGFIKTSVNSLQESHHILDSAVRRAQDNISQHEKQILQVSDRITSLSTMKGEADQLKGQLNNLIVWKTNFERNTDDGIARGTLDKIQQRLDQVSDKVRVIDLNTSVFNGGGSLSSQQFEEELNQVKKMVDNLDTFTKAQLTELHFKVENTLNDDKLMKIQDDLSLRVHHLNEQIQFASRDIQSLEKQMSGKLNINQFESVAIQIKTLQETLSSLSVWVHGQSSKQSNEIHRILMDLCQQMTLKQTNQSRQVNDLRLSVDSKMESLSLMVHEHTKKNENIEDSMKQRIRNAEEALRSQMDVLKQSIKQANVYQEAKFSEFELTLQNAAETNAAHIANKLAEFAAKNEVQMMDAELKLLESKLNDMQSREKAALTSMENRINGIQREILNRPDSIEKTGRDIKTIKEALRHLQDGYEKKHISQLENMDALNKKVTEIKNGNGGQGLIDIKAFRAMVDQVNMIERELYSKVSDSELRFKLQQLLNEREKQLSSSNGGLGFGLGENKKNDDDLPLQSFFKPNLNGVVGSNNKIYSPSSNGSASRRNNRVDDEGGQVYDDDDNNNNYEQNYKSAESIVLPNELEKSLKKSPYAVPDTNKNSRRPSSGPKEESLMVELNDEQRE